jgi:hypothetical protein
VSRTLWQEPCDKVPVTAAMRGKSLVRAQFVLRCGLKCHQKVPSKKPFKGPWCGRRGAVEGPTASASGQALPAQQRLRLSPAQYVSGTVQGSVCRDAARGCVWHRPGLPPFLAQSLVQIGPAGSRLQSDRRGAVEGLASKDRPSSEGPPKPRTVRGGGRLGTGRRRRAAGPF